MSVSTRSAAIASATLVALALAATTPLVAQDSLQGVPFGATGQTSAARAGAPQPATSNLTMPGDTIDPRVAAPATAGFMGPTGDADSPIVTIDPRLAQIDAMERQDFGVPVEDRLHSGAMHGPTPIAVPGARTIVTSELQALLQGDPQALVFDILGSGQALPNALPAVPASAPGHFDDETQRSFGTWLAEVAGGRDDRAMVFYCQSVQCWMSWNAALRAVKLGYRQVLWYRGGIEAWQAAGLPLVSGR